MKNIILVIVAMTLLQTPIFAQKVAFLIGVGNIKNNTLNTDKDLEVMSSLLDSSFDEVIILKDDDATYNNVKNKLESFYSLKESDTFLFYYTGHGCRAEGGFEEIDKLDEFLLLSGYNIKSPNIITNKVMIDDEFNYHFSKIKAKKILLYDCCHSQTQNKSLSSHENRYVKSMETIFALQQSKNQTYLNAEMSNYIKLSACLDTEMAEDSMSGGIFTLTLKDTLKNSTNISFDTLIQKIKSNLKRVAQKYDRSGNFNPNISYDLLSPKNFNTKDIFAIKSNNKTTTLEEFLNTKIGGFEFKIHSNKKEFQLYEEIILTSSHNSNNNNYLYMIEVKQDKYKLITKREKCKNQECIFRDLVATKPLGRSNIYLISTQKKLRLVNSLRNKDLVESLKSQLKHQDFKVGIIWFNTVN